MAMPAHLNAFLGTFVSLYPPTTVPVGRNWQCRQWQGHREGKIKKQRCGPSREPGSYCPAVGGCRGLGTRQAKCFDVYDDSLGCPSSWGVWAPCRITAVILVEAQYLFRDTLFIDMQGWGLCFSIIPIGAPQNWHNTFLEPLGLYLTALRVGEYLQTPGH